MNKVEGLPKVKLVLLLISVKNTLMKYYVCLSKDKAAFCLEMFAAGKSHTSIDYTQTECT